MNEIFKIEEKSLPDGIIKLQNEKNLYLYGIATPYSEQMLKVINNYEIELEGIIVSQDYYTRKKWYNYPIYSYEFFKKNNINIIVGFDILKNQELLDRLCLDKNIDHIYFLDGCNIFCNNNYHFIDSPKIVMIDNYFEVLKKRKFNSKFYYENIKSFLQTYEWLYDAMSKKIMKRYLEGCFNLTEWPLKEYWDEIMVENQYFPDDIIELTKHEVFIDCGAYTGDTFLWFSKKVDNFDKYYALEPDKRRYESLKNSISKNNKNVVHIPIGAWSETKVLRFSTSLACGTIEDTDENEEIYVDKIDNIIPKNERVSFIKMDIEGAELEAIKGAAETIRRNKPKLAICVYHKREDLIQIPQLIKKYNEDYKFYLRAHFPYASELVLYAI